MPDNVTLYSNFYRTIANFLTYDPKGAPQVTEKMVDSQKAVDNRIKIKCEQFIANSTEVLLRPLISLNELAKVLQKDNALKSHQIFNSADNLKKSVSDAITHLKTNLELVQSKMSLYLSNKDTEAILFKPIQVWPNVQHKHCLSFTVPILLTVF